MFGKKKDGDGPTRPSDPARDMLGDLPGAPRPFPRPEAMATVPRAGDPTAPRRPSEAAIPGLRRSGGSAVETEGRKLVVGKSIVLSGEIKACEKLVVEGRVDATLSECQRVEIMAGGIFKGSATVDSAEISGQFDGDMVVRGKLVVKATGRLVGSVQYGEIEIERGGAISGHIEWKPPSAGALFEQSEPGKPAASPAGQSGGQR
jgi:cytoskeletal protein CcmA (bactofilin family)